LDEIKKKEKRKKQVRIVEKTSEQSEAKNSQEESSQPLMSDSESNLSIQKDEDHDKPELAQITPIANIGQNSQTELTDQDSEPLSEKARGKLPEGVTVASRRRSNESNNVITPFAVGKSGFVPTEDWVCNFYYILKF
jgi:hypothetical protein